MSPEILWLLWDLCKWATGTAERRCNKPNRKDPHDKMPSIIYSFRSILLQLLECHDLAKGHHVWGTVHPSAQELYFSAAILVLLTSLYSSSVEEWYYTCGLWFNDCKTHCMRVKFSDFSHIREGSVPYSKLCRTEVNTVSHYICEANQKVFYCGLSETAWNQHYCEWGIGCLWP